MRNWLWIGVVGMVMMGALPVGVVVSSTVICGKPTNGEIVCTPEQTYTLDEVKQGAREAIAEVAPQIKRDRACLARMEEAMKAIEPFIINHYSVYKAQVSLEGWTEKAIIEYLDAVILWENTARDCWKGE